MPNERRSDLRRPPSGCGVVALLSSVGLLVSVVPFAGGAFAIALGVWFRRWGAEKRRTASRHRTDEPATALDAVRVGERARVVGTLKESATIETPLGQKGAFAAAWIDTEPDQVTGGTVVWRRQWGDPLHLACAGGDVVVESDAMDVFSTSGKTLTWSDEPPEQVARALGPEGLAAIRAKELYEYGERVLAPGASLAVTGVVAEVRQLPGSGYRDGAAIEVRMVDGEDAPVRIAPSQSAVAALASEGAGMIAGGVLCVLIGIASVPLWLFLLYR